MGVRQALEFSSEGKLYQVGSSKGQAITQTLDLIVEDDFIWTYGNHQPRIPVPTLIPRITKEFQFLGIAGEKSIRASFLKCLKINFDFNHAIAMFYAEKLYREWES